MSRGLKNVLILVIGLAIGGTAVFYYTRPAPPEKKEEAKAEAKKERKIIYYRSPMNPEATSPVPMKDPMGMDYVPVYEDGAQRQTAPGAITISPERIQKIGVKSEEVRRRPLTRLVRTVGRVEPVEDRVFVMSAKVSGWVEKLYVSRTDQMVGKDEKLLELYSPDLVSAQEEYLIALRSLERTKESPYPDVRKGSEDLLNAARQRLKYWGISDDQIKRLEDTGVAARTMSIRSPAQGSVTEKMVIEGQKIEAGETLFKVIDHSRVWVYGEIYEYEMPYIKLGQKAALSPSYSPAEVYEGKIEHIYTHLGSIRYAPEEGTEIRTAKVRFELPNPEHRLKLGMYLNVEIAVDVARAAIAVPDSAVIDTGIRQVVIVDKRDGTFEPRGVEVGAKAGEWYQILKGVKEGEWVVTSANFLVDSESNLQAAIRGLGHGHADGGSPPAQSFRGKPVHEGH